MADTVSKVVEAERFLLRDAKGRVRARLTVMGDGRPVLGLYDRNGTRRATLGLKKDGAPYLRLAGPAGKVIWRAPQRGEGG